MFKLPPTRTSTPLYLTRMQSPYWTRRLSGGEIYVQFNQVAEDAENSVESFSARLSEEIRKALSRGLIVDVRHNPGGDAGLLDPLVDVLAAFAGRDEKKLAVLTGRETGSAAQIFVAILARDTPARFFGEPANSKPNFVGEDNPIELAWSGARGGISNRHHEIIPGDTRQWIEPRVGVELSSTGYFGQNGLVLARALRD
jgi:hypothetical protein